ncbi:low molecular weight phosphotyrosine protein phosphatase [Brachybacterium sp. EF45031]|uniref:low molecular weight protein-tyrosine-phosphatase n=1 Tax=Brachybacterium sillae TaxID=2810536 RepID=UPI00217CF2D0|nr:low molecular weight protein-tyrosine-phosphatase [Brachybacterium sillae]MCS6712568.1 low molecular weight phosphotyrosine protein phosphatase [Brachybacterium sillae]
MTYRILTVCTGNICRSPMAQLILQRAVDDAGLEDVEVRSAGTTGWEEGEPIDPRAAAMLTAHGIDSRGHVAHQMTRSQLEQADLILLADHDHLGPVERLGGRTVAPKVRMLRSFDPDAGDDLGIRDPWYGDDSDFEATYDMLVAAVPGVIDHVRSDLAGRTDLPRP